MTTRKLVTPTTYFVSLAIGKLQHVAGHTCVSIGWRLDGCLSSTTKACVLQTMALFESSADLCVTATGPADKTAASTYKQEEV